MSLSETSALIAESRKIVDSKHNDAFDVKAMLDMILNIVTNIDNRMGRLEANMNKRVDELNQSINLVSSRVSDLEKGTHGLESRVNECVNSCEGVSNLFDKANTQIKQNTRNIIHQDGRLKKLEDFPTLKHQQDQPISQEHSMLLRRIKELENRVENAMPSAEEMRSFQDSITDLQCRSMKNNLIFTGLAEQPNEEIEIKLRRFIFEQLGIENNIAFGNVHRFGKRTNGRPRPIVARFIYHKELRLVLENATWLKHTPYGIHEQFPKVVEDRRKSLYPVVRDAKRKGYKAFLVRDKLFINGKPYVNAEPVSETKTRDDRNVPTNDAKADSTPPAQTPQRPSGRTTPPSTGGNQRPMKRQRYGSFSPVLP